MTNDAMINELRKAFGSITRMDPDGPIYDKLCKLLDRADNEAIKAVYESRIPFVSKLAFNRMMRRGLITQS